jgi:septum formation protein
VSNHSDNASFVLASRSPQRQALLRDAGFEITIEPADLDEDDYPPNTMPIDLARDLAFAKANLLSTRLPDAVILGADTVVALGDHIIGKPLDAAHAREIVRLISGTTVIVITGIAVVHVTSSFSKAARAISAARIRSLSDNDLERYMLSGAWRNRAGAFGLQDENTIVSEVRGCRANVVGLPIKATTKLLAEAGVFPRRNSNDAC